MSIEATTRKLLWDKIRDNSGQFLERNQNHMHQKEKYKYIRLYQNNKFLWTKYYQ